MSSIKIKQHDITDCGAACLASIASHYKLNIPISRIRQLASTDKKGTNVLGMIEAAEKLKFVAKGVRGDIDSLIKIPKPAIAHVIVKEVLHHFVVIYKVTKDKITVMDPGDGKMHIYSYEEFKKQWTGVLILLLPDDDFEEKNEKVSINKRLWFLFRPHKGVMLQAFFGAVVFTILGLSTSIYVQKIVDHVLVEGKQKPLEPFEYFYDRYYRGAGISCRYTLNFHIKNWSINRPKINIGILQTPFEASTEVF